MLVTPLMVFVLRPVFKVAPHRQSHRTVPRFLVIGYVVIAALVGALATGTITTKTVTASFDSAAQLVSSSSHIDESNSARAEQASRLLGAWEQRPIQGYGFGAVIEGYARNDARPWNFELQYHLILFQTGLVGAACGLVMLGNLSKATRRTIARNQAMRQPLVVAATGAITMLLVNATNPYLQAPGHMWPLYLMLAVVNSGLIDAARVPHSDGLLLVAA
jgi:O-antigen ligase